MNRVHRREDVLFRQYVYGNSNLGGFFDFLKPQTRVYETMPTISKGADGPVVARAQELLGVAQTGEFGSTLENQVKAYQMARQIPVTGAVDPQTWAALLGEDFKGPKPAISAQGISSGINAASQILSPFFLPPANQAELLVPPTQPVPASRVPTWLLWSGLGASLLGVAGLGYVAIRFFRGRG